MEREAQIWYAKNLGWHNKFNTTFKSDTPIFKDISDVNLSEFFTYTISEENFTRY